MQPITKNLTSQTVKIYWQHSKRHLGLLVLVLLGIFIASGLEILKPLLYKQFFDALPLGFSQAPFLIKTIIKVLAIAISAWALWRMGTFGAAYFQAKIMRDLLNTSFNYLQQHSYSFFSNNFAGSLVRKVNKFSRSFEQITDQFFWSLIPILIRITAICVVVMLRSKVLGFVILIWSIFYIGFNYWFALFKLKYDVKRTEMDTLTTGVMADTITNNINLKLFTSYDSENKNFQKVTKKWYQATRLSWDLHNINEAAQGLLMVALEFFIFYYAIKYWQKGLITIGDFAMIEAYLLQLFNRLWDFGRNIRRIYEGFADAQEMTEILNTPHGIRDQANPAILKVHSGKISFKKVNFAYNKQNLIFKNFDFNIKPGEKVALIGPSGGGKTTVVKLLFRFYDIYSGEILIDDQNISEVTQNSLRSSLSLVPQDPILFHRSLMENIRYGKADALDKEVFAASKLAHAHEFISAFPEGYNTFVGERGIKLSGGERQRVAIARAILKNAPILVLDEATSSLDSESEMLIQDALKNLMKNKTAIVIAHRLSTIMQMDRIVVLDNGQITEEGRHDELLKVGQGTYQKLWKIQAGGFAQN